MDLHQIKYFLAVVDHNGINAAAAVLDVAQPTVSQAIQGLERELGVPLFHRIGRGVVLTSAGHSLVGPARRILRDVVAAEGSLVDAAGRPRGRLDVFAMAALSADPVARLVGAFRREFPKVSIRIGDLRDETAAASLIREGHCEIVVCHLPAMDCAGLAVRELGVQEYWLVLPPGSAPLSDSLPDPLPLAELPDLPQVTVPRGSSLAVGEIEQAVAAAGRAIRPSVVVEHREARLPFVLAGVGATFLERSMAEAAAARGAVVRSLEPRISRAYGLVYDPAALSPAGRAFVGVAEASCP
ncbi:LysR family transcriptional regulator [Nonomuraea sp. SYSU D8015]|uniref:LysR family transcriptional regulator n=1 Tax=Nonomuraea sp. SYSU D8015 TaxID=2593644 RepID=UPI001661667F|nr:LysR family transcriptional regulator [Nonomuraea sp. SYSU D8015]